MLFEYASILLLFTLIPKNFEFFNDFVDVHLNLLEMMLQA